MTSTLILLLSMTTAISVLLLLHERRQKRAVKELFHRFINAGRGEKSDEAVESSDL